MSLTSLEIATIVVDEETNKETREGRIHHYLEKIDVALEQIDTAQREGDQTTTLIYPNTELHFLDEFEKIRSVFIKFGYKCTEISEGVDYLGGVTRDGVTRFPSILKFRVSW